ncbi:MAG: flagellar motor switch protein FliN [Desulfobacterales bacterium]
MTEDNTKDTEQPANEDIADPAEKNDPENEGLVEAAAAPDKETEDSAENRMAKEAATQGKAAIESLTDTAAADLNGAGEIEVVEDFDLNLLLDIPLEITVELGRNRVRIQELLELEPGSTVTLSKLEHEPVDILANDKLIARGEVVLQNKKYGIRITEITSRMNRIKGLH